MRKVLISCALALATSLAHAAPVATPAASPAGAPDMALEKHVMEISEGLRCLVCQNQTIADSHADLAIDLKNQVREKLQQGMTDQQVTAYMVERYGDFVLYKPPVKRITWLLWFGPFVLMIGGIGLLGVKLAARRAPTETLSDAELQRAAQLLDATPDTKDAP